VGEKAYQKLQLILNESIKRTHSFKINRLKFYFLLKIWVKFNKINIFTLPQGGIGFYLKYNKIEALIVISFALGITKME